ncbi:MAG: hypothetical protein HY561_05250 [Gemmatimonadetes bacterium]|nr:hypothetical protein [Gemmatimonadota bacterium]
MVTTVERVPMERELQVVRVRCHGGGSLDEHVALMRDLGEDPVLAPGAAVLLDLRDAMFVLNVGDAERLAGLLADDRVLGAHRVALVVQSGAHYGMARMVCTLAELRGGDASAFSDERAALSWLQAAREARPE